MYYTEVLINHVPLLPNKTRGHHWKTLMGEKQKWVKLIANHFIGRTPIAPLSKCNIRMVRMTCIEPDYDNLVASYKVVLDALTKNRIIIDDNPSVILNQDYYWTKVKRGQKSTLIKIQEVS